MVLAVVLMTQVAYKIRQHGLSGVNGNLNWKSCIVLWIMHVAN